MQRSGYFSGYSEPKTIEEQIEILKKFFPDLDYSIRGGFLCPKAAEGLFVVPKWHKLGKTYQEATSRALDTLEKAYGERIASVGKWKEKWYRQDIRTEKSLDFIDSQYSGDIMLLPAQFGMRLKGSSISSARKRFHANEFGLCTYEVCMMLITHKERLQQYDDLRIYCLGDQVNNGNLSWCASWIFVHNGLHLTLWRDDESNRHSGGVTGFLPDRFNISKFLSLHPFN